MKSEVNRKIVKGTDTSMRTFFKIVLLIIIIFLALGTYNMLARQKDTTSATSKALSDTISQLTYENGKAKMQYDSTIWKEQKVDNNIYLQIKDDTQGTILGATLVRSNKNQNDFLSEFKSYLKKTSVDGRVAEDMLNNSPLLRSNGKKDNKDVVSLVLIVEDWVGYYEVTFICYKDLYPKYEDQALAIMRTFQLANPPKHNPNI